MPERIVKRLTHVIQQVTRLSLADALLILRLYAEVDAVRKLVDFSKEQVFSVFPRPVVVVNRESKTQEQGHQELIPKGFFVRKANQFRCDSHWSRSSSN